MVERLVAVYISIYGYKYIVKTFFIAHFLVFVYKILMKDRKPFTTSLNIQLLKEIKKLAIDLDRSVNDLLEEAIEWLLKKYKQKSEK